MKHTALHLFCGLGGGALGFKRAGFETLLGVDFSEPACADFRTLTGAPSLRADLSTLSPDELRDACGGRRPDVVFTSPPCKAFSGCLPRSVSLTPTYQDMSDLSLRGVWIALEAWPVPPPLVILENVPRIQSRGAQWLEQITGLLRGYGYAVRAHTHDCGEVGGLGQRRRRFLLVARHVAQVPEVLYCPPLKRVRGCGEVLGELPVPLPGSAEGGPLHRLPKMSAMNWLRLALIPAGKDWRALPESVALPSRAARQNGQYGVVDWSGPSHTVVGQSQAGVSWASVTDPRLDHAPRPDSWGVTGWASPTHTIRSVERSSNGSGSVADPRWLPAIEGEPFDVADQKPQHIIIRAADGTWHRPMTTLELAALQGLPVGGEAAGWLELEGRSHSGWRERIGNAVPPPAAEAIARQMLRTLEASREGGLLLGSTPVWVDRAAL